MRKALLAMVPLSLMLAGCSSGSSGPGDTVPGPPRDLVEKGSQPPKGGPPSQPVGG